MDMLESTVDELSAALMVTTTAAATQVTLALGLHDLPVVAAALRAGAIDAARALLIVERLQPLHGEEAAAIADQAVAAATVMSTGRLRPHLDKLVLGVDPDAARKRRDRSVEQRKVVHGRTSEGTAFLSGCDLPEDTAAAAHARIAAIAGQLKRGGDPRSLDQLRADVYLDLLAGVDLPAGVGTTRGVTDIVLSLATLAGL